MRGPPANPTFEQGLALAGAGILAALIFALDLSLPLGYALPAAYVASVLLALRAGDQNLSLTAAAICTLLTWIGYALSSIEGWSAEPEGLANRAVATLLIWATLIAGLLRGRARWTRRLLATIVESSSDAIFSKDLEGTITSWNRGAERMYGYTAEEMVGRCVSVLMPADRRHELGEILGLLRRGQSVVGRDATRVRKDGTLLPIHLSASPLRDERGSVVGGAVIARDVSRIRAAENELRRLNDELESRIAERTRELEREVERRAAVEARLRELTAELLIVEDRERGRLAETLHDGLSQTLVLALMRLAALRDGTVEDAPAELARVERMIRDAHASAHSLTFQLSPPLLRDVGFVSAVQWLCEDVEERFGLKVDLVDDGRPKTIDERTGTTLFRSLRELLINVSKHAGVSEARVELQRTRGQIRIDVSDAGAGFNPASTPRGFGLSSAQERMDHLGGSLSVRSEPGRGTQAVLSLPLRPAAAAKSQ